MTQTFSETVQSVNHFISHLVTEKTVRESDSCTVYQLVSLAKSVSQSLTNSFNHLITQSVSQSVSRSVGVSVSHIASQSASHSVSQLEQSVS